MTLLVRFDQRVSEISSSLLLLRKIEDLASIDKEDRTEYLAVAEILRAGLFVQTYNIVEATVRDCLISTWSDIETAAGAYHQVRHFWRDDFLHGCFSSILKNERGIQPIVSRIDRVFWSSEGNILLSAKEYSSGRIRMGGNIGFNNLEEIASRIGLGVRLTKEMKASRDLDLIRDKRNSLAHGDESFAEVGREYTHEHLSIIIGRAVDHLRRFVRAFDRYRSDKRWRRQERMS